MPKVNMQRRSMSATYGVVNSEKPFLLILSDGGENGQIAK
jgi:hypothetical protein